MTYLKAYDIILHVTCADRHARRSGVRPKALSSRTLCCVGLVFYKKKRRQEYEGHIFTIRCLDRTLQRKNI